MAGTVIAKGPGPFVMEASRTPEQQGVLTVQYLPDGVQLPLLGSTHPLGLQSADVVMP